MYRFLPFPSDPGSKDSIELLSCFGRAVAVNQGETGPYVKVSGKNGILCCVEFMHGAQRTTNNALGSAGRMQFMSKFMF